MLSLRMLLFTLLLCGQSAIALPSPQYGNDLQSQNTTTTQQKAGQDLGHHPTQSGQKQTVSVKEGVIVFNPETGEVTDSQGRVILNLNSAGHIQTSKYGVSKKKFKTGSFSSNSTRTSSKMHKGEDKADKMRHPSPMATGTSSSKMDQAAKLDSANDSSSNSTMSH